MIDLNRIMARAQHQLNLQFDEVAIHIRSNDAHLLDALSAYYTSYAGNRPITEQIELFAIEAEPVEQGLNWTEVSREVGKKGRKEAYAETDQGRWILKYRTGMQMLQRLRQPLVIGPCRAQIAQVINFINNQYLNHFQREGYLLGHASGFVRDGQATAIAASSGGGKSTLMLRFLECAEHQFLTNDRLLFKPSKKGVDARGIAKMPRVNPGTLLHSERLRHLLSVSYQTQLRALQTSKLWSLEDKYDVQIEQEYGTDRVRLQGQLEHLILLDWSLDSNKPTEIKKIDPSVLERNPEQLRGLMKSPGPFYQDSQGQFQHHRLCPPAQSYFEALCGVNVFQITGRVDFDAAVQQFSQSQGWQ